MIDPMERWAQYGEKPDFAGLLTFGGAQFTEDPGELQGFDVAIVGAPMDDLVSDRPGARLAPRAIRGASSPPGPHLEVGVDAFAALRIVDFGDAPVIPADPGVSHAAIEATVGQVMAAGALPVVLGGDHAISYASIAGLHARGPLNVVWFDAHTDFCAWSGGESHNHKQVLRRISGLAHLGRIVQIGHRGMTYLDESRLSDKMMVVTAAAAATLRSETLLEFLRPDQSVYISVDIDAVDPNAAPGTGHPVPGGLSPALLIELAGLVMSNRHVVGLDLMEVNPLLDCGNLTSAVGANILLQLVSALAQERETSGARDEGQRDSRRLA